MLFFFVLIAFAALILTGVLRRYALSREMIDIPNWRSSHSDPTPHGGGAAIVLTFLVGLTMLAVTGTLPAFAFWALLGGGAWVGAIGWLDDLYGISVRARLAGHFIGAAWALAWLGGLPPLPFFGFVVDMGMIGSVFAALYLVWLLNLYNFMDGIDGIAGIEAVTVCLGGAILYGLAPAGGDLWQLPVLLSASVAGFLFWNFPPARIFMGDVGSGFLGFVLGMLSIQAAWVAPELFWGWVILLGAFVVDATVTLLRRAWRGRKVYKAHRSHAYQHAARRCGAHTTVALAFGTINLLWLLPLAALVVRGVLDGFTGLLLAYTPLLLVSLYFGAGTNHGKQDITNDHSGKIL